MSLRYGLAEAQWVKEIQYQRITVYQLQSVRVSHTQPHGNIPVTGSSHATGMGLLPVLRNTSFQGDHLYLTVHEYTTNIIAEVSHYIGKYL